MKVVIFAGGYGSRLWPLSKRKSPKQFQPLYGAETSLANSFRVTKKIVPASDIYVSTGADFAELVSQALPELPQENIIIEPAVRDTAPAVAYAMARLSKKFADEPVLIRWQNSLIKNEEKFIETVRTANSAFTSKCAEFIYISVPAKFANTTVGYIRFGKKKEDYGDGITLHDFKGFTEKPDPQTAAKYFDAGDYGWNPGCYITSPSFVLKELAKHRPEFHQQLSEIISTLGTDFESKTVQKIYPELEKTSIDYFLWEKLQNEDIKVILSDYDWHYVSTWKDLKRALEKIETDVVKVGNVYTKDSSDSLVYNYDDTKLVAVFGVENLVVVNTGDSILVCSQEQAGKLKELMAEMEAKDDTRKYL